MSARKVDRLDLRILLVLAERGRESISDISHQVGLSATACASRIQRLESAGYIAGYRTGLDLKLFSNLRLFHVTAALSTWTPALVRRVETDLQSMVHVVACDAVLGSLDYVMQIYARDPEHCQAMLAPLRAHGLIFTIHGAADPIRALELHPLIAEIAKSI